MTTRQAINRLRLFYTTLDAFRWMAMPHPQLNGERPAKLVMQGRAAEVEAIIDRLESGAFL